jgi:hypothetical protein
MIVHVVLFRPKPDLWREKRREHAAILEFESLAGLQEYLEHPAHEGPEALAALA